MKKPAIIVISSHVARGSIGNRSIVFALETMGYPVWAVSTIQLPWHPGHGPSTRIVPTDDEFESFLNDLANSEWISEVGAILTGYMASPEQVRRVSGLIARLRESNPDLVHLCDPVIGDQGGLYVSEAVAGAIRDHLVAGSTIAVPNLFEASWLCDEPFSSQPDAVKRITQLIPSKAVVVTSCPGNEPGTIGNTYSDNTLEIGAFHQALTNAPNGPGDLTAALFLGHTLSGLGPEDALARTTSTVFEILEGSTNRQSNELTLATDAASILNPKRAVPVTVFKKG